MRRRLRVGRDSNPDSNPSNPHPQRFESVESKIIESCPPLVMEHYRYRSHDPGKYLRGRGEAETEGFELRDHPIDDKTKKLPAVGMDRDLKVCVLQVDGDHPVTPTNCTENRLVGLHLETSLQYKFVEIRQVYHGPPRARRLPDDKQAAVIPWRGESQLDRSLG